MTVARIALTTTLFTLALPAASAEAQCLTAAERAELRTLLETRLTQSDWPVARLYHHTYNRLSFGQHPLRSFAFEPSLTRPQLAQRIVSSLNGAANPRNGVGLQLAGLTDDGRPPWRDPAQYRAAAQTLSEAYSEVRNANTEVQRIRTELDATTDPDERARLQEELLFAQRVRNGINADLRSAAQAYRVALMTSAPNVAIGDVLNEFWTNHFNIDARKSTWASVDYQRSLRAAQCGTFYQLLRTSAQHPGMLIYLDNFRSRRGSLNENYGRELLELHTFGDDKFEFYTQDDVIAAAEALTGWGIAFPQPEPQVFEPEFRFYASGHVGRSLTLFDNAPNPIPVTLDPINNGQGQPTPAAVQRGEQLLRHLANHPRTKVNICRKLSRWLLGFQTAAIVNGCANPQVWGSDGDLVSIYRYFLTRPEFFHSLEDPAATVRNTFRNKARNPQDLVVSAYRAAGAAAFNLGLLRTQISASSLLGISPAQFPPPTGYDDNNGWLTSGLLIRYNAFLHQSVATDRLRLTRGDRDLTGDALETNVRNRVENARALTGNARTAALDRISADIISNVYRLPDSRNGARRALRQALLQADIRNSDGEPSPLRTHFHTFLGHGLALRK